MSEIANCPQCQCDYCYTDRELLVCPVCGHEWRESDSTIAEAAVVDSNGNALQSGDSVSVIRDLKVKAASSTIKVGTRVKNIRVLDAEHVVDGHDIDCKIDGFGAIKLKGSVVKKI